MKDIIPFPVIPHLSKFLYFYLYTGLLTGLKIFVRQLKVLNFILNCHLSSVDTYLIWVTPIEANYFLLIFSEPEYLVYFHLNYQTLTQIQMSDQRPIFLQ